MVDLMLLHSGPALSDKTENMRHTDSLRLSKQTNIYIYVCVRVCACSLLEEGAKDKLSAFASSFV
jgi:hypothetical protein